MEPQSPVVAFFPADRSLAVERASPVVFMRWVLALTRAILALVSSLKDSAPAKACVAVTLSALAKIAAVLNRLIRLMLMAQPLCRILFTYWKLQDLFAVIYRK
jgi:hypothetical protein